MLRSSSFLILVILLSLCSCKIKKDNQTSEISSSVRMTELPDTSWSSFFQYYDRFSFKSKIDYNDGKSDLSFTANFRIRRDSLIWVSIGGPLGIEVARAVIDKDSVKVWNKLANERNNYPLSFLNRFLPFNPSFYDVQDFLLGNPLLLSKKAPIKINDEVQTSFYQDDYTFGIKHTVNNKSYTLSSIMLKDKMQKQSMDATFENHEKVDSFYNFSTVRNINIERGGEKTKIQSEIYKYFIPTSLEFPF